MLGRDTLPDYHFLLIAPNLGAEWFFDAARLYWETFRPTVITEYTFLRIFPERVSLIVTVVARRDIVKHLEDQLPLFAPQALFDPIAYDFFDDTKLALDGRAQLGQPFGVPLVPTPTLPPSATPLPTAGPPAAPTRAPGGFVTQTPTSQPTEAGS